MFCKFVIKIRHLSIKIIYASRTGQMIVLYNNIISIIQIKNQIANYAFYLYIPGIHAYYLCSMICTFGQCAIYPRDVLSLSRGVFYILILCTGCQILGMRSTLTPHIKSIPPKPFTFPPHHPIHTTPKLYKIPTQFTKPLRQSLRHNLKISLNHYIQ